MGVDLMIRITDLEALEGDLRGFLLIGILNYG